MQSKLIFLVLLSSIGSLCVCAGSGEPAPENATTATNQFDESDREPLKYVIVPGDELEVKFFNNPELNEAGTVRPDGKISLLLIDEVKASGLSPAELDTHLTELYNDDLKDPEITVFVRSFTAQSN
ncbi:MAG: hypothetical protein GY875_09350 [Gammaproteobacteria bacterium]|nr:hypothetical protein [Gammaproteobacteria bacterium]